MPDTTSIDAMFGQTDPTTQMAGFGGATDSDLAFTDWTIPRHKRAIAMAEAAVDSATPTSAGSTRAGAAGTS